MISHSVFLTGAIASFVLASCSQPPPAVPGKTCELQTVSLSVIASPLLNPTDEGDSRPVQLRVYQLKDDVRLQNASFEDVWKKDAATLGDDIIKRDELFVYPSTRTDIKFDRDPNAQHVIGAALFRNPKGKSWFVSFDLPPAPGKGDCAAPEQDPALCPDGKCANAKPAYALWLDASRIDDGADHKDDVKDGRRIRVVQLSGAAGSPKPDASGAKSAEPKPQAN